MNNSPQQSTGFEFLSALKKEILSWPELTALINQRVAEAIKEKKLEKRLTGKELAEILRISYRTLSKKSDEQLTEQGFRRIRNGYLITYEKL